jgi:hypothetical protein
MTTRITTEMLLVVGAGGVTAENVGRVRRLLAAAGVEDVELHALEVEAVKRYREQARVALASADKLLAAGPLPTHTCVTAVDDGPVTATNGCPVGCCAGKPRIELPNA